MAKPVIKENELNISIKESFKRWTLNYTDIVSNSNKYYNIELIQGSDDKIYLYTVYGRVGASGVKEYRVCLDKNDGEKEAEK